MYRPPFFTPPQQMFRLRNQKVLVTYNGHLDKEAIREFFETKAKIAYFGVAHETGETGYEHTHVLVKFQKRPDWTDARCLDFGDVHPNIQPIKTNKHWLASIEYIKKEDKSKEASIDMVDSDWIDDVWMATSIQEAIKNAKRPSEVMGIMKVWECKPDIELEVDWKANQWQEWCLSRIFDQDTRRITWIYDKVGNIGKSYLGNTMYKCDPKNWLYIKGIWQSRDLCRVIENAVKGGWSGTYLIIDYPRSAEEHKIYDLIESAKDGMITTSKYDSRNLRFDKSIKICCMANWLPSVRNLSMDRWDIWHVEKTSLESVFNITRLDAFEVEKIKEKERIDKNNSFFY